MQQAGPHAGSVTHGVGRIGDDLIADVWTVDALSVVVGHSADAERLKARPAFFDHESRPCITISRQRADGNKLGIADGPQGPLTPKAIARRELGPMLGRRSDLQQAEDPLFFNAQSRSLREGLGLHRSHNGGQRQADPIHNVGRVGAR